MHHDICGNAAMVHYSESPWVIPGTLRGRELLHRSDSYRRSQHGRRMR